MINPKKIINATIDDMPTELVCTVIKPVDNVPFEINRDQDGLHKGSKFLKKRSFSFVYIRVIGKFHLVAHWSLLTKLKIRHRA